MAAQIDETNESRSRDGKTVTLHYFIWDTTDDAEALALLSATAPATYEDFVATEEPSLKPVGRGVWHGEQVYERSSEEPPELGPNDPIQYKHGVTFDCTPQLTKLFQSYETIDAVAIDGVPPVFNRAIGVNRGKVDGVELGNAPFTFTITRVRPQVTLAYIDYLASMVLCTNTAAFYGCDVGEALFLGATGQSNGGEPFTINYKFGRGKNKTYVEVADGLAFPFKFAWHYIWCLYEDAEDENTLIQTPVAAYMERVYESGDFTGFGI